jgi:hypothetical protein
MRGRPDPQITMLAFIDLKERVPTAPEVVKLEDATNPEWVAERAELLRLLMEIEELETILSVRVG